MFVHVSLSTQMFINHMLIYSHIYTYVFADFSVLFNLYFLPTEAYTQNPETYAPNPSS